MAVMTSGQRAEVHVEVMQELSNDHDSCSIIKTDLRAAIDAVDQWVSDNAASFNNALPTAAKNGLTASQKARLLMHVVRKRYNLGT